MSESSGTFRDDRSYVQPTHGPLKTISRYLTSPLLKFWLIPWQIGLLWVSWVTQLLQTFLNFVGVPQKHFENSAKLRDLSTCIDVMHVREDGYRRKLKELQEELEARTREKKKTLHSLQRARGELAECQAQLEEAQSGRPEMAVGKGAPWGMHLSVGLMMYNAWWFYSLDHPAVERKVMSAILFPVALVYLMAITSKSANWTTTIMYSVSWFVNGFVICHVFDM